jgi:hypothetical protein
MGMSSQKPSFTDRVAEYFKARPHLWIDGLAVGDIGGRYAWRSRISNCRTKRGMRIDRRQRIGTTADGRRYVISEYRYVPTPIGIAEYHEPAFELTP